jgi:hypothetical protein
VSLLSHPSGAFLNCTSRRSELGKVGFLRDRDIRDKKPHPQPLSLERGVTECFKVLSFKVASLTGYEVLRFIKS